MDLNSESVHVDWLTVGEVHSVSHSELGERRFLLTSAGELEERGRRFHEVEGLARSKLWLKSDGHAADFDGNPSRWNRSHALFGLDLGGSVELANGVLEAQGIAPFSGAAKLRRVDVTVNLATGSAANRAAVLGAYRSVHRGPKHFPSLEFDGTVYQGFRSRSWQVVVYDKARQLRRQRASLERDRAIAFCELHGVLRVELRLFRRGLVKRGYSTLSDLSHAALVAELQREVDFMVEHAKVAEVGDIPGRLLGTLLMYQQGFDVKEKLSVATYYRHQKELLAYGYDISVPGNLVRLPVRYRVIDLRQVDQSEFALFEESSR